jgi:CheY-like chemotaxis protein
VLLAHDHSAMIALTADVLVGEFFVVGLLGDRCELLVEAERLHPEVIVPDITMPESWLVHGITRAEQALRILARIPYNLVVIDSELPGICGIDFVRILHNSREWRTIRLVIIASSQSADFATQAAEYGAFLARKSGWEEDLFSFLSNYDEDPTENSLIRPENWIRHFSH